jgi:hypothetical protein
VSGDFSSYNPSRANLTIPLSERFSSDYKGVVLFGPCPNCDHDDGINLFIPTTWATITGPGRTALPYIAEPAYRAVQAAGTGPVAGVRELKAMASDTPDPGPGAMKEEEIVELIVCHCGKEHDHEPPAGRSGCGYWAYLHLPKKMMSNGQ